MQSQRQEKMTFSELLKFHKKSEKKSPETEHPMGYLITLDDAASIDGPRGIMGAYSGNSFHGTMFFHFMLGKAVMEWWDMPLELMGMSPKKYYELMVSPTYRPRKVTRTTYAKKGCLLLENFPSSFDPEKYDKALSGEYGTIYGVRLLVSPKFSDEWVYLVGRYKSWVQRMSLV